MKTIRHQAVLFEYVAFIGRHATRRAPVLLLLTGIACTSQQTIKSADERAVEPAQCDIIRQNVKDQQQQLESYETRISSLERELAELKLQLDERLKPTTVPATLPSDSTTLPARVPAP